MDKAKKQELWKAYNENWKKQNQTKYVVWLVMYVGSFVPLLFSLTALFGGMNDEKLGRMIACFGIFFAMEIVAAIVNLDRNRGWKKYLQHHGENGDR